MLPVSDEDHSGGPSDEDHSRVQCYLRVIKTTAGSSVTRE